ncbi:MAG: hypothetical protein QXU18_03250 [Thermoplasmatales archaeon]
MKAELKTTETEKKEEVIVHKVRFTLNGIHYVEISNNGTLGFLRYNDGLPPEFVQEIITVDPDTGKDVRILPAPQIGQSKWDRLFDDDEKFEYVKFPGMPLPYGSPYQLYTKIKSFIHKFVEVEETVEIMLPLWLMKAAIYDTLKDLSFPSVHAIAPYGKGKSRLLIVMCEATPWGFYLIDVKSAALKRVTELYQPVLYVDEKAHMDSDTAAIVNAKFNKNSVFLNADKEIQRGFGALVGYKLFGPMVLAGRTAFNDDAIESKCLQVNQDFELERVDIPRKIKGKILDNFISEGAELRSMLLQFRIDYHDKINDIQTSEFSGEFEKHLEPRLYEILSFFDDLVELMAEIRTDLRKMLNAQILRNVEVAQQTPNGVVATTILNILENSNSEGDEIEYFTGGKNRTVILLKSIYDEVGANYAKQTGRIIQSLGLTTDRPRIQWTDRDGKVHKQRVTVVRIPNEKKLLELRSRYDRKYVEEILLPRIEADGEQSNQSTLDDKDEEDEQKEYPAQNNEQNNEDKKEGSSQINRPNRPLSPTDDQNNVANAENSNPQVILDEEDKEDNEKQTPSLKEKEEGVLINDSPHRPLSPQLPEDPVKSNVFSESKDNEISDDGFGFDYYRITSSFQYEFQKDGEMIKITYKEGQIRRLSDRIAILYRSYVEKVCSNGHWDPVSKECITSMGDDKND